MKRIILFLCTVLFSIVSIAQERTVTLSALKGGVYYTDYSGVAADICKKTTNDTTDYIIKYANPEYIKKVALTLKADTIAGADTLSVQLLGLDFLTDGTADVIIGAATTNLASTAQIVLTDDYFSAADEFSFRYYKIRVIHLGVATGGIRLSNFEFKVYIE